MLIEVWLSLLSSLICLEFNLIHSGKNFWTFPLVVSVDPQLSQEMQVYSPLSCFLLSKLMQLNQELTSLKTPDLGQMW